MDSRSVRDGLAGKAWRIDCSLDDLEEGSSEIVAKCVVEKERRRFESAGGFWRVSSEVMRRLSVSFVKVAIRGCAGEVVVEERKEG
jgi:hypothetical protein